MSVVLALLISGCISGVQEDTVCIKDKCFAVELAIDPEDRARGLMEREHLDENRGMLFVFEEEGRYSFWMKDTLIPLDIIWISEDMQVVDIVMDAQPCIGTEECPSIDPDADAKYVLEINSGKSHGFNIGDTVTINAVV